MRELQAPESLKNRLKVIGTPIHCERGTYLFRRGDAVTGVFLIIQGRVRLGLEGRSPRILSREFGPGAVLGLPATLSDLSYSMTAEVVVDSELVYLPQDSMLALLRADTELSFEVMNLLSEELVATRDALMRIRKGR
jgi:CRP-like cAMP-binding protein